MTLIGATRASRGQRTICLPIAEDVYARIVNDSQEFRRTLDEAFRRAPELFPNDFGSGYQIKDGRMSAKQGIRIRRIVLRDGTAYSVRPSFLMPYLAARTDDVEDPLFLRKFGVPFWALARVFGRDPMYWYRLECSLGRASIVGTTAKVDLPEHLAADEHHQTRDGQKIYIATTVGGGCCLGAEPAEVAGTEDLTAAYGVFRDEARDRAGQHRWLEGDASGLEGVVPSGGDPVVLPARLAEDPRPGQAPGRVVPRIGPPGLVGVPGAGPSELRPTAAQPAGVGRQASLGCGAGDGLGPVPQAVAVVDRL
jgi:hypothetical protein